MLRALTAAVFLLLLLSVVGYIPFLGSLVPRTDLFGIYLFLTNLLIAILFLVYRTRALATRIGWAILLLNTFLLVDRARVLSPFVLPMPKRAAFIVGGSESARVRALWVTLEPGERLTDASALISAHTPELLVVAGSTEADPAPDGYPFADIRVAPPGEPQIRLFSTLPFSTPVMHEVGEPFERLPKVALTSLTTAIGPVEIRAFDLPQQWDRDSGLRADLVMRRIVTPLRHEERNAIIFAGIRMPPISSFYQRTMWASRARNAAWAGNVRPTVRWEGIFSFLPVDHVLFKGNAIMTRYEVLPRLRSERHPILFEGYFGARRDP